MAAYNQTYPGCRRSNCDCDGLHVAEHGAQQAANHNRHPGLGWSEGLHETQTHPVPNL